MERKFFILIYCLHPMLLVELGSIQTWGSGGETWGRRARGGAVSSQSLLQSLQDRAEAEEGGQAAVGEAETHSWRLG